ncbi:MAG: branched-chain amino acid ABC transporter permease, partial [Hyphomicrobiaceae bacterium]
GIGFTLVFGVMHKINMAYAAASIAGAYSGLVLLQRAGLPPSAVVFLACLSGAVFGMAIYILCFRFIPLSSPLEPLMSTVGMLLLIDEIVVHLTAGMPVNYPTVVSGVIDIGDFMLRRDLIFVFLVAVLAMTVLMYLLFRSKLGLATRAVSQQPVAAELCGMRIDRVNALTFVTTGALGGIAGALIGSAVGLLSPLLVAPLTIKGLIVTVIGGLGSIPGAIVAGLLVGAAENVFQFLRGVTERDMYVMLLLFAFLVFRPQGLFGTTSARD